MLWKYVMALQFFTLIFAYTLFYPGMNAMADAGLGGMYYPMLVGSCLVSFTLASIYLLKEKAKSLQTVGLVICIFGLIFICTAV
jgi:multidrug transporter EmrE-like cation transporter